MLKFKREIYSKVLEYIKINFNKNISNNDFYKLFSKPPKEEFGDLALAVFFFSKLVDKSPNEFAEDLASFLKSSIAYIDDIEIKGPYLNFYLNKKILLDTLMQNTFSYPNYSSKTIVLDYSSPNIAKPIAIHHIRSTVIGNIIANLFEKSGAKTIRINYLGDWGTQFGKLIVAYRRWGSKTKLLRDGIKHLLEIYIKFHKEENDKLLKEAREWFKKTEDGDSEALHYWEIFRDISLKEFERIYKRLNVKFTNIEGESFYRGDKLEQLIKLVDTKLGVKESQGALIVDLQAYNMPPLLLKKQDGSTLYATRDLAAAIDRYDRFEFDELLYIVASQQDLHFKQVFKTLELMGYKWANNLKHINFGLLSLPGGKMSTREGRIVFLEDVLDEAKMRVLKLIEEKNPSLENKESIAEIIGNAVVIFSDISRKRKQNIIFKWDEVLNFDGETAPYVQYTYARAKGILRKNAYNYRQPNLNGISLSRYEFLLVKKMLEFEENIVEAIETYEPFVIARYVLEIAKLFNKYYNEDKISDITDPELKQFKLSFIDLISSYIKELLAILGINVLERM